MKNVKKCLIAGAVIGVVGTIGYILCKMKSLDDFDMGDFDEFYDDGGFEDDDDFDFAE